MKRNTKGKPVKSVKAVATKKPKSRPRDVNQLAQFLVKATTEWDEETPVAPEVSKSEISRVMAELGRRGGKIGGAKRAANMTPERRREIALKAARSRWDQDGKTS